MSEAKRRLFRLLDLLVEEVSMVDRAANRRRWLVVKRGETMEFKELLDALESMPTFAAGLSAEEQTELAGALRKAADGINVEADAESSEPASEGDADDADDVQKGEPGDDLNAGASDDSEPASADGEGEPAGEGGADDVQKGDAGDGEGFDRIMSALEGLQTSIGKVSDDVRALDGRLSSVEKSVDVPASGIVESTGTEPVGNPSAGSVPWEMDLNTASD